MAGNMINDKRQAKINKNTPTLLLPCTSKEIMMTAEKCIVYLTNRPSEQQNIIIVNIVNRAAAKK